MADQVIKNAVVPKEDLPPLNSATKKYLVRYRIVSEDRNRVSHWSPQYLISPVPLAKTEYSPLTVTKGSGFLVFNWETDARGSVSSYDIYVAWGTSSGSVGLSEYYGTITGNQVMIPIPAGKVSVAMWVQRMSYPRERISSLTVASTETIQGNSNGVISTT